MKYKGFGLYIKKRKAAGGEVVRDYRIIPPKGVDWPAHLQKNGPALKTDRQTVAHMQQIVDRVDSRNYNIEIGRAVNSGDSVEKLFTLYREYGQTYGGKSGWSAKHYRDAGTSLEAWRVALNLKTVTDIKRIPFEQEVHRLLKSGLRPGTVENRARFLTGFCGYAKEHCLLAEDPLAAWPGLNKDSQVVHGRLEPVEIRQLLLNPTVTLRRKIIYGLAYFCRLRRGEIHSLKVSSMDWVRSGVRLDPKRVKNRDPEKCWVPVPQPLLGWIWEDATGRAPDDRLTSISKNNAIKYFRRDLKRAKLSLVKDGLERTFHGLGASTATNLEEAGASPFAIQDVMRHASVDTSGIYLREREKRIRGAQRLLVGEVFTESENNPDFSGNGTWQKMGNGNPTSPQVVALQDFSPGRDGGIRNGNPPADTSENSQELPRNQQNPKNTREILFPGTAEQLPEESGRELLAKAWQRLAEPAFVDLLRICLSLPLQELPETLEQFRKLTDSQPGRAQA